MHTVYVNAYGYTTCVLCVYSHLPTIDPLLPLQTYLSDTIGQLIQSINSSFFSLTVLLTWEAVVFRVQRENNSIVSQVLEKFLMFSDPQLSLNLSILLCHWALNVHSWIYPFILPLKTVLRGNSTCHPRELLECLFMLPFSCIVAYIASANTEPYLPSRFFAWRMPRLTFATQVWLQKINSATTEAECPCPLHVYREKESKSCSPDVHPALADICDLTDTTYASVSFRSPQPFNSVSPNFTKSMSFLQCFGGLNLGQEYQQRAAGTNIQPVYLIRYSRMQ